MVDILERVQEICDKGEKNDPDVVASCIQEIKEEKAGGNTTLREILGKTWKLTKDWKAMEKMEKWGWKRKKATRKLGKLECVTVEECADFKCEE